MHLILLFFGKSFLYSGLSTLTHIEYRIKSSKVTYTFYCFFWIHNMYTFQHKKKQQLHIEQLKKREYDVHL